MRTGIISLTLFFAPVFVFAATPRTFAELVSFVVGIIGQATLVIFALTIVAVIWGIAQGWIIKGDSEEGVTTGKQYLIVGIIALVFMLSIWGIVALFRQSLF